MALEDLHGIFLKPTAGLTDRYLSYHAATVLGGATGKRTRAGA